jgi:hypothetical protein
MRWIIPALMACVCTAGCLPTWGTPPEQAKPPAGQVRNAAPPPPVTADMVTTKNAWETAHMLRAELEHEAGRAPAAAEER